MADNWPKSVLLVGCGNMGGAMLAGWLAGGINAKRFTIVDPVLDQAPGGVRLLRKIPAENFDAILLGVKPQILDKVAPTVIPAATENTVVMSILAGVTLDRLSALFPAASGIVRIMPNLAVSIGKSPVALAGAGIDDSQREAIAALMQPLGTPEWVAQDQFDLITALAGSGPAYVYRFIDSLGSGAAALGLDPKQAGRLAVAMVEGAAQLAAASAESPGELAKRVASPGGTTEAGLNVLDQDDAMARLIEATLRAARDRSAQMGRESGG